MWYQPPSSSQPVHYWSPISYRFQENVSSFIIFFLLKYFSKLIKYRIFTLSIQTWCKREQCICRYDTVSCTSENSWLTHLHSDKENQSVFNWTGSSWLPVQAQKISLQCFSYFQLWYLSWNRYMSLKSSVSDDCEWEVWWVEIDFCSDSVQLFLSENFLKCCHRQ